MAEVVVQESENIQLLKEWESVIARKNLNLLHVESAEPRFKPPVAHPVQKSSQRIDTTPLDAEKAFLKFIGKNAELSNEDYGPDSYCQEHDPMIEQQHRRQMESFQERLLRLRHEVPETVSSTKELLKDSDFKSERTASDSNMIINSNRTIKDDLERCSTSIKRMISINSRLQKKLYGTDLAHTTLHDPYKPADSVAVHSLPLKLKLLGKPKEHPTLQLDKTATAISWSVAAARLDKAESQISALERFCGSEKQTEERIFETFKELKRRTKILTDSTFIPRLKLKLQLLECSDILGQFEDKKNTAKEQQEEFHTLNSSLIAHEFSGEFQIEKSYKSMKQVETIASQLKQLEGQVSASRQNSMLFWRLRKAEAFTSRQKKTAKNLIQTQETLFKFLDRNKNLKKENEQTE